MFVCVCVCTGAAVTAMYCGDYEPKTRMLKVARETNLYEVEFAVTINTGIE